MIATMKMKVNESKSGDSLTVVTVEGHPNKGLKYNKNGNKKNIVKYFTSTKEISDLLVQDSKETKRSQSSIIEIAIKKYFNI